VRGSMSTLIAARANEVVVEASAFAGDANVIVSEVAMCHPSLHGRVWKFFD
jgi:hypothetical protein